MTGGGNDGGSEMKAATFCELKLNEHRSQHKGKVRTYFIQLVDNNVAQFIPVLSCDGQPGRSEFAAEDRSYST